MTRVGLIAVLLVAPSMSLGGVIRAAARAWSPTRARLIFNGDYSTGNLRQWFRVTADGIDEHIARLKRPPRDIEVVRAPGGVGGWAARFTGRPREPSFPGEPGVERAEIAASQRQTAGYPGREAWYGWQTYFPSGFRAPHRSAVNFTQVKRMKGRCGSPNLAFVVNTDPPVPGSAWLHQIRMLTAGGRIHDDTGPQPCIDAVRHDFRLGNLRLDHWYSFVVHVRWSDDPAIGFVELWIDGKLAVPLTHLPTIYSTSRGVYWKQGLFTKRFDAVTHLYHRGFRVGTSRSVVDPARHTA